jgi:MFS family permease
MNTIRNSRLIDRSPVFYGWVILVVATVAIICTTPAQSFAFSLFIDHFIEDFGLTRTEVTSLVSVATFLSALSLTWIGKQVDRYGCQKIGTILIVIFPPMLMMLSQVRGPVTLFFGFLIVRVVGQGSLFLVSNTAITQWWQERRGWVMGLMLVTFALFRAVYLPVLQGWIDAYGWQKAWIISGLWVGALLIPLWPLLMRDRPETYGQLPDRKIGAIAEKVSDEKKQKNAIENNLTLAEVRKSRIFWLFLVGRLMSMVIGSGLIFHQVSIFGLVGHSAEMTAENFGVISLVAAMFILVMGRIIDHVEPKYVLIVQLVLMAATGLLSLVMTETWMTFLYAAFFGIIMAIGGVFDGTVWANLYGRLYHGEIRGFVTTVAIGGISVGPVLYALSYDLFGSYQPIIFVGTALILVELVLFMVVKETKAADSP